LFGSAVESNHNLLFVATKECGATCGKSHRSNAAEERFQHEFQSFSDGHFSCRMGHLDWSIRTLPDVFVGGMGTLSIKTESGGQLA